MPDILIIRSVSYQQLDKALPVIRQAYPGSRVVLLTHEHGEAQARAMPGVDDVRTYPHRSGFSWRRPVPVLRGESYEVVIIPVANATGAGFWNVCLFALGIRTRKRVLCNVRAELRNLTQGQILAGAANRLTFACIAAIGTLGVSLILLPILAVLLPWLRPRT